MEDTITLRSEVSFHLDSHLTNNTHKNTLPKLIVSKTTEGYDSDDPLFEIIRKIISPPAADPFVIHDFDEHLPSTVSLLKSPEGAKVYLVGTVHFSNESRDDVSTVIRNVRPHIVVVELCESRASVMLLDEETIERVTKKVSLRGIIKTIKENGIFGGLIRTVFGIITARASNDLDTTTCGEFRRAFSEVKKLLNCKIFLGDRPIEVTFKRLLSVLRWWQIILTVWYVSFSSERFTKENMEQYKQKDALEQILKEMSEHIPEIGRVFIEERDMCLTYSLQLASQFQPPRRAPGARKPTRVVGIVGMGHVPGITKLWGTVKDSDIPPLMEIPPPSKFSQIFKATLKITVIGFALWVVYKLITPMAMYTLGKVTSLMTQIGLYEMFTKW